MHPALPSPTEHSPLAILRLQSHWTLILAHLPSPQHPALFLSARLSFLGSSYRQEALLSVGRSLHVVQVPQVDVHYSTEQNIFLF